MHEIENERKNIINEKTVLAKYVAKEIELKAREGKWPFETLKEVEESKGFIYWWIVNEEGIILLADDVEFMQTNAYEYFPEISGSNDDNLLINDEQYYGILRIEYDLFREKESFWLVFSLESIMQLKNEILIRNVILFSLITLILGVFLLIIIKKFTNPLVSLKNASDEISKGNFNIVTKQTSKDEIGDLTISFNNMTKEMKKSRKELENYSETLEKKVKERTNELESKNEELEKFNKLAVGRELRMIELKKKIKELEEKLQNK